MTVDVSGSVLSPVPLGTVLTLSATPSDVAPGSLWYRFRARRLGDDRLSVILDYGPKRWTNWAASDAEGFFEFEVSVRNLDTGEETTASTIYEFTSRVKNGRPVLTPTDHPLVWLYSAPPCPVGGQMRVQFRSPDGFIQLTDAKPCRDGLSMNFYLAGMRSETTYFVRHTVALGADEVDGPDLNLTTPRLAQTFAANSVLRPAPQPWAHGILLQSSLGQMIVATDLNGNPVWYYPGDISFLTHPEGGGLFLGITWDPAADPSQQILREFDLAGITVRETNAARVNEQLQAKGIRPITAFHHEARRLPDGNLLVLASNERILTDVQGPGPVDVIGDMILVLDADLNVLWTWDAFDHLDPRRVATLNDFCLLGTGGCPPFRLAERANDWLHGNALELTPDGNILYSARAQDWLIKIDYRHGRGSGDVLWKLGKDGDFQFLANDPYPWFSHQHDARFLAGDNSTLVVFDNGNTHRTLNPNAHSRGQVIKLDESKRTASFVLNADLGVYSLALGSAQSLPNGNYHFDVGWIPGTDPPISSRSVEVDPDGRIVYDLMTQAGAYRTFRMRDLYTR